MAEHNQDYDMAVKYGKILPEYGFQVIETRKRRVNHGNCYFFNNKITLLKIFLKQRLMEK